MPDYKTFRLLAEREAREAEAEREADYLTYDGVPIPDGPPREGQNHES